MSKAIKTRDKILRVSSNQLIVDSSFELKQIPNMKAIAVILTVFFVAALGELTDEQKTKLREYKESCMTESSVDLNVLKNAKEGIVDENNEKLACFATCLLKKIGVMKENGELDIDVIRSKVSPATSPEEAESVIKKCQGITETDCWKGGALMKCIKDSKVISLFH